MAVIKEPWLCVKILLGGGVGVAGVWGQSRLGSSRRHATLSFTAQGGQVNMTTRHNADRKVHADVHVCKKA